MARLPPQKNIHSDIEMDKFMTDLFEDVINKVGQEIMKDLQEIIQDKVYDFATPKKYQRQYKKGGLYSAWYVPKAKPDGYEVETKLEHVPQTMKKHVSGDFIHGSDHWKYGDDIRNILADIIINGGIGTPHVGPYFDSTLEGEEDTPWWKLPRDFWTPFIKMLDKGEVDLLIKIELNKMGIGFMPE